MKYGLTLDYTLKGRRYRDMFIVLPDKRLHYQYLSKNGEWQLHFQEDEFTYSELKTYLTRCKNNYGFSVKTYKDVTKRTYYDKDIFRAIIDSKF